MGQPRKKLTNVMSVVSPAHTKLCLINTFGHMEEPACTSAPNVRFPPGINRRSRGTFGRIQERSLIAVRSATMHVLIPHD